MSDDSLWRDLFDNDDLPSALDPSTGGGYVGFTKSKMLGDLVLDMLEDHSKDISANNPGTTIPGLITDVGGFASSAS